MPQCSLIMAMFINNGNICYSLSVPAIAVSCFLFSKSGNYHFSSEAAPITSDNRLFFIYASNIYYRVRSDL